jgi:Kef-type K+ transport system membrane component KefB
VDVSSILLDILVVLIAAKLAAELAERVNVPAVVGEIVAGVIIGPSLFGLVDSNETLSVLGEIGVILLLLGVGMEMDVADLGAVGRSAMSVACVGVVLPMAGGFAVASALGHSSNQSIFIGAALAATSVGITARVFSDLRALATVEARTVLGAAVADDVLGLVILTVVVRLVSEGSVSVLDVALILLVAIGFLVVATIVGSRLAPGVFQFLDRHARSAGTLVAIAFAFTLGFAELADAAQLAPIVGAFVAGLALSGSTASERIQRELAPVGHLFIPVFFLEIGISARVETFVKPEVLGIAAALLGVAIVGKILASAGALGAPGDKLLIGLGMIPRGEVGLIFATIGLREGILGGNLYAALLLVVLATTLVTPPLLRWRLARIRSSRGARTESAEAQPVGGWLRVEGGVVELTAVPPSRFLLLLAFDAALAVAAGARPGTALLDWIGAWSDAPVRWDDEATTSLLAVLERGDIRAWRFLETTGVLERAMPELAEAVDRRRTDPFLTDPAQVLRFGLVDRIRELVATDPAAAAEHARLRHPAWLLLAALIFDTAGEDASPVALARRIAQRLDLGAAAEQEVALLVGDSGLLRAAARKLDALEEARVYPIAVHLEQPERARALYLLTLAIGDMTPWERERLDELRDVVIDLLERPDVTGLEARNLVERRRAEARRLAGSDRIVADRIEHAPRAYVLASEAADIARHAGLIEPLPARDAARVAVVEIERLVWRVEVAARDRAGLLAVVSGVLADQGLDVLDAVVATWPDGGALDSFSVRRAALQPARLTPEELDGIGPPDPSLLEDAVVAAFRQPLDVLPNPDAEVRFDDDASPWYTLCEVRSPDRRGLLHNLAAGMALAGADVHSAHLVTVSGYATDRFELTDRRGNKLDDAVKERVVEAIRDGAVPRRRLLGRRR